MQPDIRALMRTEAEHGDIVFVRPATLDDLKETSDPAHRKQNIAAFGKDPLLREVVLPHRVLYEFPYPCAPK